MGLLSIPIAIIGVVVQLTQLAIDGMDGLASGVMGIASLFVPYSPY